MNIFIVSKGVFHIYEMTFTDISAVKLESPETSLCSSVAAYFLSRSFAGAAWSLHTPHGEFDPLIMGSNKVVVVVCGLTTVSSLVRGTNWNSHPAPSIIISYMGSGRLLQSPPPMGIGPGSPAQKASG